MTLYTKDFQINLIGHLVKDEEFFRRTSYLRLTDFELVPCQLILETVRDYYHKFHKLPDFQMLCTHVVYMLQGNSATVTQLIPEEMETLSYILDKIELMPLNTPYYIEHLPEFLKFVRTTQILRVHGESLKQGQPVDDLLAQVTQLNSDIANHKGFEIDSMLGNPEPIMKASQFKRIPTMLKNLNTYTAGGLGFGELGMIVACPGVGKTTSLINFQVAATLSGYRTLFITLELAKQRIKHRMQAIMGHIPAGMLRKPMPEWPEDMLYRYSMVVNPSFKYFDYPSIVDMSTRRHTLADIEQAIAMWIEGVVRQGGKPEEAALVCVDWADYIDPSGITITKQTREDVILTKTLERLGLIGRKYHVGIWTATQGTRQADGVENLEMKHTANSYHKNDPVDISMGLAALDHRGVELQEAVLTDDNENTPTPPCSRDMKFSIMKNRDNPLASFAFYQGQTLRYWNTRYWEQAMEAALAAGDVEKAASLLK